MQGIRLNEYALVIQLAEQLPEHRPLVVFAGGITSLADGHTQGGGVKRDLSNECRAAAGRRLDRGSQGLADTPAGQDRLQNLGSERSSSPGSLRIVKRHQPDERSSGKLNPTADAAAPGRVPR
jgi:hypothetical protein